LQEKRISGDFIAITLQTIGDKMTAASKEKGVRQHHSSDDDDDDDDDNYDDDYDDYDDDDDDDGER
jgi:hypothetical protein